MADKIKATAMVVEFILSSGLYDFNSLEESTQKRLITAYGPSIESDVNKGLGFGLV
jgi:hypothetical protein